MAKKTASKRQPSKTRSTRLKGNKNASKDGVSKRVIVATIGEERWTWLDREARKLAINRSAFLRLLLDNARSGKKY